MVKKLIPTVFLTTFLALSTGPAFAESVAVVGDKVFIADNVLSVLDLATGDAAECSVDPETDLAADLAAVSGATDVVVTDDGTAVVTVGEAGSISVKTVDVSACLEDIFDVDVDECVATVDLDDGVIEIPCVYYNDVVYEIEMEQRGNSSNWEISFINENGDMLDYRHDDNSNDNDDDDEDDENDNED